MDQSIKAGLIGTVLAVFVNLSIYIPAPLDFLPTFIIAIFVIFIFRLITLKDGLITAFMTYIFNQGIIDTLILATYYNEQYPAFNVNLNLIINPIITAISTVIAAYIGVWLAKKRTPPPRKTQQESTDIPPELQTV
jgi:hypothetical protein